MVSASGTATLSKSAAEISVKVNRGSIGGGVLVTTTTIIIIKAIALILYRDKHEDIREIVH